MSFEKQGWRCQLTSCNHFNALTAIACELCKAPPHVHSQLSDNELSNLKVIDWRKCMIDGLPIHITEQVLNHESWFGRFKGGIKHIDIKYHSVHCTAWITFNQEQDASNAINFVDNAVFDDGRKLKATYGTNQYCFAFMWREAGCYFHQFDNSCPRIHEYTVKCPGISDEYASRPYGLKIQLRYLWDYEFV